MMVFTTTTDRFLRLRSGRAVIVTTVSMVLVALFAISSEAQSPCARITVAADLPTTVLFADDFELGSTAGWVEPAAVFRSTEILDVIFRVEIEGEIGDLQILTLRVAGPNGSLFRELTVPLTINAGRAGEGIRVDGFPHPLRLSALERGDEMSMVEQRFPVAGTSIVSNSVYGGWRVTPLIDGIPASCEGGGSRFVLLP